MSDDNEQGFTVNDRRRLDHEGHERPLDPEIVTPDEPGVDGVQRRVFQGVLYEYKIVDGEVQVLTQGGHRVEPLQHSWPACPECGEVRMQSSTDRPLSHDDCRGNPKNAMMGALYPQGPPGSAPPRRPSIQRDFENYNERGPLRHQANNLDILGRAMKQMGFDPGPDWD